MLLVCLLPYWCLVVCPLDVKGQSIVCWGLGLQQVSLSEEGWPSTICKNTCVTFVEFADECFCISTSLVAETTFAVSWQKVVVLSKDVPAGFLGVTSQESSSVRTCQWMKGWKSAENTVVKLTYNWVNWNAVLCPEGAWLYPNPPIQCLCKVGQQENQHISVMRSDDDARCLARDTVEQYSSVCFFMLGLQLLCANVKGWRIYLFFIAETTGDDDGLFGGACSTSCWEKTLAKSALFCACAMKLSRF